MAFGSSIISAPVRLTLLTEPRVDHLPTVGHQPLNEIPPLLCTVFSVIY